MKLIDNWRQSWRMYSMQALALVAALPLVWEQVPPEVHALIPEAWRPWIMTGLALSGMIGRVIDQRGRE